jgi:CubicO group peptidase (beta-lactamase class C family)
VQDGRLNLDRDVNAEPTEWHVPPSDMTGSSPVTLRGLLSMTAGIGVPGYRGYAPGAPLPNLTQILDGIPPANSPPVRVEAVPGQRYAYSGGGYEIVQAIIQDATHQSFDAAMQRLVLRPVGMADLMKRGQNIGYQSYMLVFPNTGQGIVVMTNSDNGTTLAAALVRRAAQVYRWPMLDGLPD